MKITSQRIVREEKEFEEGAPLLREYQANLKFEDRAWKVAEKIDNSPIKTLINIKVKF